MATERLRLVPTKQPSFSAALRAEIPPSYEFIDDDGFPLIEIGSPFEDAYAARPKRLDLSKFPTDMADEVAWAIWRHHDYANLWHWTRLNSTAVRALRHVAEESGWSSLLDAAPTDWNRALFAWSSGNRGWTNNTPTRLRNTIRHVVQVVHNAAETEFAGPDRSALLDQMPLEERSRLSFMADEFDIWHGTGEAQKYTRPLLLLGLPTAIRIELLWLIHICHQRGELLLPLNLWLSLGKAVVAQGWTTLSGLTREELIAGIRAEQTVRATAKQTAKRAGHWFDHGIYVITIATENAEWWTYPKWHPRYDPRIPMPEIGASNHVSIDVKIGGPDWLEPAWRYYASRMIIRSSLGWGMVGTRSSIMRTHIAPLLEEHSNGLPSLGDTDAEWRNLLVRINDYIDENFKNPNQPRAAVTKFFEWLDVSRDEVVSSLGMHMDQFPSGAGAFIRNEAMVNSRGAGKSSNVPDEDKKNRYLDDHAVSQIRTLFPVLEAPMREPVEVKLPGREPMTLTGCGGADEARVIKIMMATGRRLNDVVLAPHDCLRPLMTSLDEADYDDTEDRPDDPFVAMWAYGSVKTSAGKRKQIPIRQSTKILIEEAQASCLAHVQQFHDDATPKFLFISKTRMNRRGTKPMTSVGNRLGLLAKQVTIYDAQGIAVEMTRTHQWRVRTVVDLLDSEVPPHVVKAYLGHQSVEMTMRYDRDRPGRTIAQLEKAGVITATGEQADINADAYELFTHLDGAADRILPNGVCTLPRTQSCDKGNACWSCSSFITHAGHLDEHQRQLRDTNRLIEERLERFREQTGREMPEDNVWLVTQRQTAARIERAITVLTTDTSPEAALERARTILGQSTTVLPDSRTTLPMFSPNVDLRNPANGAESTPGDEEGVA